MPAAFAAIRGVAGVSRRKGGQVSGIAAPRGGRDRDPSDRDPLPIFPSLLTDGRTSIARRAGSTPRRASGRHRTLPDASRTRRTAASSSATPATGESRPALDRIEFRASLSAAARSPRGSAPGQLDLARDLLPQDLEAILREPRFRAAASSRRPRRTPTSPSSTRRAPPARTSLSGSALASAARTQDFVWGALGRFALPATGSAPAGNPRTRPGPAAAASARAKRRSR